MSQAASERVEDVPPVRRFKKRTAPQYVKTEYVMPPGVLSGPGITVVFPPSPPHLELVYSSS